MQICLILPEDLVAIAMSISHLSDGKKCPIIYLLLYVYLF